MIGRAAKNPQDVLESLNKKVNQKNLIAEYKYDGERTQIHWDRAKLSMFSRNCDTQETKFWDLFNQIEF